MAEGRLMWMAPKILISNDENNIGLTIQLRLPVTTQNSEDLKHRNGLDRAGAVCHALALCSAAALNALKRSKSTVSNSYSPHERAFSAILAILTTFDM